MLVGFVHFLISQNKQNQTKSQINDQATTSKTTTKHKKPQITLVKTRGKQEEVGKRWSKKVTPEDPKAFLCPITVLQREEILTTQTATKWELGDSLDLKRTCELAYKHRPVGQLRKTETWRVEQDRVAVTAKCKSGWNLPMKKSWAIAPKFLLDGFWL